MKLVTATLLTGLMSSFCARSAPIVLYQTGWEAAPANPGWALGNVVPQNGWSGFNNAVGHQVVSNGSPGAVVSGQAVVTPYGRQFHKFVANSDTTTRFLRLAYPDISGALASLPPTYKIFRASLDVFVPSVEDGVAGAYRLFAYHGATAPWGVLVDPSNHSVRVLADNFFGLVRTNAFALDTWFHVQVTADYNTSKISIDVNGVNFPDLTTLSSQMGTGALTDIDLVAWNYDLTAPPTRVAFSDNFLLTVEEPVAAPTIAVQP